jgi:DNA (cytosine-5)-methyltransferase 1
MAIKLTYVGLFAGIGGFELGFSQAGHRAELLCDSDSASRAVLAHRFPETRLSGDVADLEHFPASTEVVLAGFPCQNLSMVGDKTGVRGKKTGVVEHLFRLLTTYRAPWVVLENVPFMLYLRRGRAMDYITEELEKLGYAWAYRIVDSRGFGLAQRRRRVFVVAVREGDPRSILLADDAPGQEWPQPDLSAPIGFYWSEGNKGSGLTGDAIPPLKTGSGLGIPTAPAVWLPQGRVVVPTIEAAERLQGFPAGWTSTADGFQRRAVRWRLVGNAVSVPVAEWLGRRFAEPGIYEPSGDMRLLSASAWPKAGWGARGARYRSHVSETPLRVPLSRLSELIPDAWPDVSERALEGFVGRARKSSLRFPKGFLVSLEAYISTKRAAA